MVLAAGVGSRLEPLTLQLPKPLIPIGGRPIMEHIVLLLKKHGFSKVVSNTHYLGQKIQDYFADAQDRLGVDISFIQEEELSGVAGGIRRCKDFLKESTACIIMGDALTDIDLSALYEKHREAVEKFDCLATIAMMKVEDTSQFGVIVTSAQKNSDDVDDLSSSKSLGDYRIEQFQEKPSREEALSSWANTGVYFFEPGIYNFIPDESEAPVYDVAKDLFPRLLREGKYIQALPVSSETYWADLGNPNQYLQSMNDLRASKVDLDILDGIHPSTQISPSAELVSSNEIGPDCELEDGVVLENTILWSKVKVPEGAKLKNCIIASNTQLEAQKELNGAVLAPELQITGANS